MLIEFHQRTINKGLDLDALEQRDMLRMTQVHREIERSRAVCLNYFKFVLFD